MTAAWLLIVLLHAGDAGFTADFYTKETCEEAGQAIIAKNPSYQWNTYMCVRK